jgi:hypothetical protein
MLYEGEHRWTMDYFSKGADTVFYILPNDLDFDKEMNYILYDYYIDKI